MAGRAQDRDDERFTENWGKDSFFYKYNLFTTDGAEHTELQMILDEEYKNFGKYGEVYRKVIETGMTFAEAGEEVGVTRQRAWDCFRHRFVPRVRRRLAEE